MILFHPTGCERALGGSPAVSFILGRIESSKSNQEIHKLGVMSAEISISLLSSQTALRSHDTHHILIRNRMSQANSLRHVLCTRTPDQRILEAVFKCPVDRIANILDVAALSDNKSFVETGFNTLALGVNSHELEFFPTPLDHFFHAEVELTGHDGCVWLACEVVEMLQADAVDLVVDVETLDVRSVVFHDDIDELVDRCCGSLASSAQRDAV